MIDETQNPEEPRTGDPTGGAPEDATQETGANSGADAVDSVGQVTENAQTTSVNDDSGIEDALSPFTEAEESVSGSPSDEEAPSEDVSPDPLVHPSRDSNENTVTESVFKAGRDIILAGKILQESADQPVITELPESRIERYVAVFVPPADYTRKLENWKELPAQERAAYARIWLICGPEHHGKKTCAINLATELLGPERGSIAMYQRTTGSTRPLSKAIRAAALKENMVLVVLDAQKPNTCESDLSPTNLESLAFTLPDDCFVILTAETVSEGTRRAQIPIINGRAKPSFNMLEKHVRYGWEGADIRTLPVLKKLWGQLRSVLINPLHIQRFAEELIERSSPTERDDKVLTELAKEIFRIGSASRAHWFRSLSPNEKLMALLVQVFEDVDRDWLEKIYLKATEKCLAEEWLWLSDPREQGVDDIFKRIRCQRSSQTVNFEDNEFREESRSQFLNYRCLAWDLMSLFLDLLLSDQGGWQQARKRSNFGRALGRLGPSNSETFKTMMGRLAKEPEWARSVIVGYSLQEFCRSGGHLSIQLSVEWLKAWIRSRDSCQMWSASAAIPRVFSTFCGGAQPPDDRKDRWKRKLVDIMFELARTVDTLQVNSEPGRSSDCDPQEQRKRDTGEYYRRKTVLSWCCVESISRLAFYDPWLIVERIRGELASNHSDAKLIARRAVVSIVGYIQEDELEESNSQVLHLISLLSTFLLHVSEDSKDFAKVFLTLRAWIRRPEAASILRTLLLTAVSQDDPAVRQKLRVGLSRFWICPVPEKAMQLAKEIGQKHGNKQESFRRQEEALSYWLHDSNEAVRQLAREVIIRSYAMDGVLIDPPVLGEGMVILDPGLLDYSGDEPERKNRNQAFLWNLLTALEAQTDIRVTCAGARTASSSGEDLGEKLRGCRSSPPLVMPAVEELGMTDPSVKVVVTGRVFPDLEDLLTSPWANHLFLLHTGAIETDLPGDRSISISWPPKERDEARIEEILQRHWARQIAFCPPRDWLPAARQLAIDLHDETDVESLLESYLEETADFGSRYDIDPVRRTLTTVFWYAATDLESCLEMLRRWLLPRDEDPLSAARRATAAAAAVGLLRVHTSYDARDGVCAPTALFGELAGPLAAYSSEGLARVLGLVRHWMQEPAWTAFLAGDVQEGKGQLYRWAETLLDQGHSPLQRTLEEFARLVCPVPDHLTWESLQATFDRLLARTALAAPGNLKPLAPEERYLLLLLDTRDYGPEDRRRLERKTRELCRQAMNDFERRLVPIVYRMGERHPCWGESAPPSQNQRFFPEDVQLPPLIGPLLSSPELTIKDVASVLILTGGPVTDLDDWRETAWVRKIAVQSFNTDCSHSPAFPSIHEWGADLSDYSLHFPQERAS